MTKYQIDINWGMTSHSFEYFETENHPGTKDFITIAKAMLEAAIQRKADLNFPFIIRNPKNVCVRLVTGNKEEGWKYSKIPVYKFSKMTRTIKVSEFI